MCGPHVPAGKSSPRCVAIPDRGVAFVHRDSQADGALFFEWASDPLVIFSPSSDDSLILSRVRLLSLNLTCEKIVVKRSRSVSRGSPAEATGYRRHSVVI